MFAIYESMNIKTLGYGTHELPLSQRLPLNCVNVYYTEYCGYFTRTYMITRVTLMTKRVVHFIPEGLLYPAVPITRF